MDESVPKLVYLDRDRGWQLPDSDDRDATIADLRAVLAPLLDRDGLAWYAEDCCQFCGESRGTLRHAPDCPVLRRDELLGR